MLLGYALQWLIVFLMTAFGVRILYGLLIGEIALSGLLTMDGNRFSPERLQLILVTVAGVIAYVGSSVSAGTIVEIPDSLLVLFGVSHSVYLGGKVAGR